MRKFMCLMLLFFIFSLNVSAYTTPDEKIPVDVCVNDNIIKTDSYPFINYDTVFVPIRFVSEALGASVSWDSAGSCAQIKSGAASVTIYEGSKTAYVNGKAVSMNKSAEIRSGRLFIPVRFIAENLGANVSWDETYYSAKIYKQNTHVDKSLVDYSYTTDEILWLAKIINAESEGEPSAGKIGVGNVILNRVRSSDFPDTIYGVIFDRNNGVQFEPIMNGTINNTPASESFISAKRALRGENTVGECLYFFNPKTSTNSWIKNNRTYYTTIRNHDFYL